MRNTFDALLKKRVQPLPGQVDMAEWAGPVQSSGEWSCCCFRCLLWC